MSAKLWRTDVQGLRAIAVGLVVAAHAGIPHTEGGFVGVDVFFVLSDFLITTLHALVILVVLAYAAWRLPATRLTDAAAYFSTPARAYGSALKGTRAAYVDTQRFVCAEDRCPLVVGEKVAYYDNSHLTESWVRHVTPRLGAILAPLI